ncbi:hypothetical protein HII13_004744 [Brettanomyces bruxellensis]|nr:hypothetical protein HII13_004744 [Brettanomyces bruxellensis]
MTFQVKDSQIRVRAIVIEREEPEIDEEEVELNTSTASSFTHAVAGGLASMVSLILVYPLASLATTAQAGPEASTVKAKTVQSDVNIKTTEGRKEALTKALTTVKELYAGLSPALVGIMATNSPSQEKSNDIHGLSAKQSIIAGIVGGIVSRIVTNPIWVANTRMTVSKGKAGSQFKVMYDIVKNEGWKKLFAGLTPALTLVSNPVIQYTIFEQLKTLVVSKKRHALTAFDALYLGAISKFIATLLTYPYYTVRARMHMAKGECANMYQIMKRILKEEGISSFYNGLGFKLLQSIIGSGFLFYFKEEFVLQTQYILRRILAFRRKRLSN